LVFSSQYAPLDEIAIIINHGENRVTQDPVPSPSSSTGPVPEPATLWLLGSAVCLMALGWRFRQR
jgi:hypothetical protein